MACCDAPLLGQLQGVMNELAGLSSNISGSGAPCCQQPCCPPPMPVCTGCCPPPPHPICCMPCPPPLVLPTLPEPVKPLMMPVEKCENRMSDEEQFIYRHANFYNNYNIDWKTEAIKPCGPPSPDPRSDIKSKTGVTIDGKNPLCPCGPKKNDCCTDKGCPTGFKPCVMKMRPPANCHPCGLWCAEIQECPPKLVGKSNGQRPCPKDSDICPIHCVPGKCKPMCFNR
ncbi:uncharacterized protein LOC130898810 isoform X3 [Diorhabda carinulata]|uniref:uncharacterized protein LOC130898810 isoform X3 n=1 Tax=Diorhabda carinulata TaxID=1163345 RepID=UPI0025A0930F|nr:uncharacterized protein LOC130898810 isoform X3 [Diorhabda carinulata]